MTRAAALAMAVGGVGMGVLALLPWYGADLPDGMHEVAGTTASGELWSLPVLGAVAVLAAVALTLIGPAAGPTPARRVGLVAVAAGALGAVWALRGALDPPVRVTLTEPGGPTTPLPADLAPVQVLPAGWVSVAACCVVALAGLLVLARRAR